MILRLSRVMVVTGLLVLALATPHATAAEPLLAVYDLDWQLRYYLKDDIIYNLDWQIVYYIRDNSVFDKKWVKRYYLKDTELYDWNWQRRYFIREYTTPQPAGK